MKWLLYIFSCYVLLLSGIPCKAGDNCCIDEMQLTKHTGDTAESQKPAAPCSPFFACCACHGVIVPDVYFVLPVRVTTAARNKTFYRDTILSRNLPSVWQPPKA